MESSEVKRYMKDLSRQGGNQWCAECQRANPTHIVTTLGAFVCSTCASVHLGQRRKVKNFEEDVLVENDLKRMEVVGNDRCNRKYLAKYDKYDKETMKMPNPGDLEACKSFIWLKYQGSWELSKEEKGLRRPTGGVPYGNSVGGPPGYSEPPGYGGPAGVAGQESVGGYGAPQYPPQQQAGYGGQGRPAGAGGYGRPSDPQGYPEDYSRGPRAQGGYGRPMNPHEDRSRFNQPGPPPPDAQWKLNAANYSDTRSNYHRDSYDNGYGYPLEHRGSRGGSSRGGPPDQYYERGYDDPYQYGGHNSSRAPPRDNPYRDDPYRQQDHDGYRNGDRGGPHHRDSRDYQSLDSHESRGSAEKSKKKKSSKATKYESESEESVTDKRQKSKKKKESKLAREDSSDEEITRSKSKKKSAGKKTTSKKSKAKYSSDESDSDDSSVERIAKEKTKKKSSKSKKTAREAPAPVDLTPQQEQLLVPVEQAPAPLIPGVPVPTPSMYPGHPGMVMQQPGMAGQPPMGVPFGMPPQPNPPDLLSGQMQPPQVVMGQQQFPQQRQQMPNFPQQMGGMTNNFNNMGL